ncbi:ABC transporter permease [Pseudoruegeria sp. HB172150]|uniref:ABC transporter permease n=1 Tax=Pseudoruegeria sp. HB172150 TaxID=2721164 RepID=UPI001557F878|nr:ABC transporter permease [Pseudoruegeria sp. HB172150]
MDRFLRWTGIAIVIFIAAPLVIVVPMSFSTSPTLQFPPPGFWLGYYAQYFTDESWLRPTFNSLLIALMTTILTMALVVPATFALVRHKFWGKGAANVMMMMPMAVPHIVMAVGYYSYFGSLRLVHSHLGVILAHTCLAVPITFLVLSANLKGFDRTLERAARSLGATPRQVFIHITLPILRPGLLISALFAFIQSFDETVVAIFISGRDAETLPRKMFDSIRQEADPVIAVISTLLFVAVFLGLIAPHVLRLFRKLFSRAAPKPVRATRNTQATTPQEVK